MEKEVCAFVHTPAVSQFAARIVSFDYPYNNKRFQKILVQEDLRKTPERPDNTTGRLDERQDAYRGVPARSR